METCNFKSEEDLLSVEASSDSFWDIENYQRVVKRIEHGARLCTDLVKMAQERVEIEAKYSRALQQWAKKWDEAISKGPEYGTLESGWKACLTEATKIAGIHTEISNEIQHDVIDTIQIWKGEHFHKTLRGLKEVKRAEESFTLGQKPWIKRLEKMSRAKKAYHQSASDLQTMQGKLRVAETSPDVSAEQCTKTREKCERAESNFDKALDKYKSRLTDVQHYQPRYIEDLTIEFNRCQGAEQARMEFFKQVLYKLKKALDISANTSLPLVYSEYEQTLSQISPDKDLDWYTLNFGTGMGFIWPEFEPHTSGQNPKSQVFKRGPSAYSTSGSSGTYSRWSKHNSLAGSSTSSSPGLNQQKSLENEAGYTSGDEWMEPPPVQDGVARRPDNRASSEESQGKLMRAIYDYSGPEKDDLCFKEGDIVRIMYEGENGWAEGMMDDKYGYVPITYLEAVEKI